MKEIKVIAVLTAFTAIWVGLLLGADYLKKGSNCTVARVHRYGIQGLLRDK